MLISELRELLLVYRRDVRVLRHQLGAVMEENDELRLVAASGPAVNWLNHSGAT